MKNQVTRFAAAALAVTLLAAAPALAHDQSLHKGKATDGEIVSVEQDRFTMMTEDGERKVTLGETTRIEVGDAVGSRDDLKGGAHVAVFGTKLPGGEIVAKEIVVRGGAGPGHAGGHGAGAPHEAQPHEAHE